MMAWEITRKAKQNKNTHNKAYSIQHGHLGRNKRVSSRSTSIVLLVLVSRRLPLPMLADLSLLAGGDSCYCSCIRVLREVCLNGLVFPPICALRGRPFLLPENHHFEMVIGEFDGSWSISTSVWEINLPPHPCSGCRVQPPLPFPPRLVVAPVGCSPRLNVPSLHHRVALFWVRL